MDLKQTEIMTPVNFLPCLLCHMFRGGGGPITISDYKLPVEVDNQSPVEDGGRNASWYWMTLPTAPEVET